jgi:hypothetical protein
LGKVVLALRADFKALVMPGHVPGIHVLVFVDTRIEPGHDEGSVTA